MDLGFDIHLGGRAAKALSAEAVRPLTEADLALLATERGIKATHVQRISARHHALARCLASGMSVNDACAVTSYTPSRVSILKSDPAFEELIAFYTRAKGEPVLDLQDRFTALAIDATTELQERLELTPETVSTDQLMDVVKLTADRTGHGPQSKTTNVNVNVNLGDRLAASRQRAAAAQTSPGLAPQLERPGLLPCEGPVLELQANKEPSQ